MMIKIAFDIGGTFTDFVLENLDTGRRSFAKVLSSHHDPSESVLKGVRQLLDREGAHAPDVQAVLHATTVATNAIIERKGSRTALLTTKGFRDILLLGRQKRYEMFDLHQEKPQPLIQRRDIFEVPERVLADGTVEQPVDMAALDAVLDQVQAAGYESVAVCFLHSYAEDGNERTVKRRIQDRGMESVVALSSEVSPKQREYERTSTTVADAYVKPIVKRYINNLTGSLAQQGITADLFVIQSNGGLVTPELAVSNPISIVESGPAAGVLMCAAIGKEEGCNSLLTFDMGGTTAKLGAIDDGEPAVLSSFEVDQLHYKPGSGLPLNISAIELLEIGAGGGSIAKTSMGLLKLGPESAGSAPGPICYGNGGTLPTITDANLVLGYLNPEYFNGGAMGLNVAQAEAGILTQIAKPLGISLHEAAWGIHAMANANMERAMRIVSVERGRDPRHYSMVGFGGAGPLHAVRLGMGMGIRTVIIPVGAGVGSAVGLLRAAPRLDYSMTTILRLEPANVGAIAHLFAQLRARMQADLERLGAPPMSIRFSARMRYAGQGYELSVDLPADPTAARFIPLALERFAEVYQRTYGYADIAGVVEGVDWQLTALGEQPAASALSTAGALARGDSGRRTRPAYFPECGGFIDCAIHVRQALTPGQVVTGPAIIEEPESTTVVPPGCYATVSQNGHVIVTIETEGNP